MSGLDGVGHKVRVRDRHKYMYTFKYRISFKSVFHRSSYLLSIEETFFFIYSSDVLYLFLQLPPRETDGEIISNVIYRFTFSILILNLFLVFNVLGAFTPSFCISVFSRILRRDGEISM